MFIILLWVGEIFYLLLVVFTCFCQSSDDDLNNESLYSLENVYDVEALEN